jgi:putative tricarboxylic transport membrane protein
MSKYTDLISGIFWFGIGLLLSIWSTRYQIGSLIQPGPGFLSLVLGLLLILLSFILLARAIKSFRIPQEAPASSLFGGWKKVAYTVLILVLGAFFFETIGYLLTFFFLVMLLMKGAGSESWKRTLLVAFLSALGVYLVFVLLLEQPFPRGLLGI